jgi:hypothetical protein
MLPPPPVLAPPAGADVAVALPVTSGVGGGVVGVVGLVVLGAGPVGAGLVGGGGGGLDGGVLDGLVGVGFGVFEQVGVGLGVGVGFGVWQ